MIVWCQRQASANTAGTAKGFTCSPSESATSSKASRVCSSASPQLGVLVKAYTGGRGGSCSATSRRRIRAIGRVAASCSS